jgi:hypothetical protein
LRLLEYAINNGDLLVCVDVMHGVRKSRNFVCSGDYDSDGEPGHPLSRPSEHDNFDRGILDEDWAIVSAFPFRLMSWTTDRRTWETAKAQDGESLSRRLLGEDSGGSMIEIALSSTVLLAVLLCMLQICLVLYAYCCTAMAAREGTRYAIVRGSSCNSFTSQCPAAKSDIQSYIQGLQFPAVNAAAFGVTTTYSAYPSGTCSPSASCNNPGNLVKIQVTYSYLISLPMVSKLTFSLSSTSQMIISQ